MEYVEKEVEFIRNIRRRIRQPVLHRANDLSDFEDPAI